MIVNKIHAELGRAFDCVEFGNTQPRPVRIRTLKPMPHVKRVPRTLNIRKPCNIFLQGQQMACCNAKFCPYMYLIYLHFEWQSKFCLGRHLLYNISIVCLFSEEKWTFLLTSKMHFFHKHKKKNTKQVFRCNNKFNNTISYQRMWNAIQIFHLYTYSENICNDHIYFCFSSNIVHYRGLLNLLH